jgi:hypothetical protein
MCPLVVQSSKVRLLIATNLSHNVNFITYVFRVQLLTANILYCNIECAGNIIVRGIIQNIPD